MAKEPTPSSNGVSRDPSRETHVANGQDSGAHARSCTMVLHRDHLYQEAIAHLIRTHWPQNPVETPRDLRALDELLRAPGLAVIALDYMLLPRLSAHVARSLRDHAPPMGFLVVSELDHPDVIDASYRWGADAFVSTRSGSHALLAALHKALIANKSCRSPRPPYEGGGARLSIREEAVLTLVARGLTNVEIAEKLLISRSSVEGYRLRAQNKIGAQTRAEMTEFALRTGLLSVNSVQD